MSALGTGRVLSLAELREGGYLQELNRQFLHPLGLALAVGRNEAGEYDRITILDAREDEEGFVFSAEILDDGDAGRAAKIADERGAKAAKRMASFGWVVQPIGAAPERRVVS